MLRLLPVLLLIGCGGLKTKLEHVEPPTGPIPVTTPDEAPPPTKDPAFALRAERAASCRPVESEQPLPLNPGPDQAPEPNPDFLAIKELAAAACASCHLGPGAAAGGFSYVDSHADQTLLANGESKKYQGLASAAKRFEEVLASGRMPPANLRAKNPARYESMAKVVKAWIQAGTPAETKAAAASANPIFGLMNPAEFTSLGDCVPEPSSAGKDLEKDLYFQLADALPPKLADTDLTTFDAYALSRKGTYYYDVEYPLWTDNSGKGRMIHLPAAPVDGEFKRQAVTYDYEGKRFVIPENTRFYKTFFKATKAKDGKTSYRPIESRIIVVRSKPIEPLFGTYVWNAEGTEATLLTTPYRDGTPWKDRVLTLVSDEKSGEKRKYAVPARHRCVECHMGSEQFVLGFTPLQINRRELGEGGRTHPIGRDELAQVEHLVKNAVIRRTNEHRPLPRLEQYPADRYINEQALRAQGYLVGNCSHCHNPTGFAMKTHNVKLDMSAGQVFRFNTLAHSKDYSNRRFVDTDGEIDRSYLYFRASAPVEQQGLLSPMPLHSPGGPDCEGLTLIGKWILTYNKQLTPEQVDAYKPKEKCTKRAEIAKGDFHWTEEDFTSTDNGAYKPRRLDWADADSGMPARFRELKLDDGLKKIIETPVAVGFFTEKPECAFPTVDLPETERRPWMLKPSGEPKKPFGQIYRATPGAWYFITTCSKCHGDEGRGDGEIGRSLLTWSGGQVRVADFMGGMFGASGANLKVFDTHDRAGTVVNLAPQYLIWMAMEGTKINVPPQAEKYLGKHKAQMLKQIKERCSSQIKTSPKPSSERYNEHEIFRDVCLHDNLPADAPEIQFNPENEQPLDPVAQEKWLDKGALNAGWAIYEYLKQAGATGAFLPRQTQCEKVHPRL